MRLVPRHAPGRRSARPALAIVLALGGALAAGAAAPAHAQGGGSAQPTPVVTTTAERGDADVYEEYAGRVRGAREVEVRARIQGILEERLYEEGQRVAAGDSLFAIDAEPYAVALQSAKAEQDKAEAELRQAQREWERISRLYERNAISERERDTAYSNLELARAQLAVANAAVDRAALEFDYTAVQAPISGVTSLEVLSEGSLVERGTLLTTIVQQDPVHVHFALPETDAALQRRARRAMVDSGGDGNGGGRTLVATLILPGGETYGRAGEVDFTASTVDPDTGTISARAVFPNPEHEVVPGQFVRVRSLVRTMADVIVLPERAVAQGPQGPRVFIVEAGGGSGEGSGAVARARPVELGPVVPGGQVITGGLGGGERVVVEGHVSLQDGAPVAPQAADSGDGDGDGGGSDGGSGNGAGGSSGGNAGDEAG